MACYNWLGILLLVFIISPNCYATKVHDAIVNDDIQAIKSYISLNDPELDTPDTLGDPCGDSYLPGVTPLYYACWEGSTQIVSLLVNSRRVNPSLPNYDGITPIHTASKKGFLEIVQILLEAGADPDVRIRSGETALHLASYMGQSLVVDCLIRSGRADINARVTDKGWTPLHLASQQGALRVVHLLLACESIDANARLAQGQTPLCLACATHMTDTVEALLNSGKVDVNLGYFSNGATPLHLASSNGFEDIVSLLLAQKLIQINARTKSQETPLHLACLKGQIGVVELLLRSNADRLAKTKRGLSCADIAIAKGNKVLEKMLELYIKTPTV